ncbi:MAG: Phospho-N-acetylmuramoyl-pentapeptide-transferase [Candidatus Yanofskybacteria bacterium GW2011_GWA1_44_21]|uniref:Phospho-N-acetylmuramoyl-pentapeptide-transferase n=1 Tax=Candidatus Wolfebacteria bacterium GW2011_GWB1_41_12 TaxID=1619006 RepID=A0A0G0WW79_9BACT|nr:MAG: Phospho-N-acetylmuramoyl-pentapeptide-transferase [Candidatus Wolfebacteria bacterium GW2011_GWB1_41_12]KKT28922.1 MAG: Phospho-N-acetylmuramoyl-pentapeptide-transferase [Candidatus Yanofskybacteria bacterium GW2011_GWA2_44_10]KKT50774.1 MAG: Phospho-N-acetylmuramoyl-pentapeptide-transferase [Candidatus Yanofskybacteria bacterium GW2011_GWA1_44_21]
MNDIQDLFTVANVVRIFVVATIAFFLNLIITHFWTKILLRYFKPGKQIERPDKPIFNALHKKKEGTPTMGGFPIWVTVSIITLGLWALSFYFDGFWGRLNFLSRNQTWLPLGLLIIAGIAGFADDALGVFKRGGFGLSKRLLIFTVLSVIGAWWFFFKLGRNFINVPFLGDIFVGWFYIPYFIFIMVATAFSMNETDGLDGLSGGIYLIMFAAYTIIAFDQGRMDLVAFMAAIMGALIGFLWFNIYPAKFFMGDTGVMALGFVIAGVALLTDTALLLPLIAVVPLMESLSVIVQMFSKKFLKRKIFPSTPIHHTFEAIGWPETQITMRFWMINAMGAAIGLIIFLIDSKIPPLF